MAGFSGGRKLICPGPGRPGDDQGVAQPEVPRTPQRPERLLTDNPVHEENTWIARRAGCDFIVNAVIDAKRRILSVVAGDMEAGP